MHALNASPRRRSAVAALLCLALLLVGTNVADAAGTGHAQATTPSAIPSTATPNILDGIVYSITQVGSQIIVGGSFTQAQNQGSSTTLNRTDVLAFDASTGTISTTFAPTLDGKVQAVEPGPTANTVYVGGWFKTVNGVNVKSVALLNTQTGQLVPGFTPPVLDGAVFALANIGTHLLVGGAFTVASGTPRGGLASLNPSTGALDSFLTVQLLGHHNWYAGSTNYAQGPVGARKMSVNPAGNRLMVVGNFTTADGYARDQIVMIDLNSYGPASVDQNWATLKFTAACHYWQDDTYVTDVQYSPDGTYFAVSTTGGMGTNSDGSRSLCDAASRFNSADTGTNVAPVWVDYTGGDTFWSIAVTGSAVYAGGHQRWLNNSLGKDKAMAGAVPRAGLVALDPLSGIPLSWNPGRNPRGAGTYAIYATDNGLYIGSDTDYFGDFYYKRQKIGYFPLAGGAAPASTTVNSLPANVYLAGPLAPSGATRPAGADDLAFRPMSGSQVGAESVVPNTGVAWSTTRGAFLVGNTLFFGSTDGNFYRASFSNGTVGTPTVVDPYNDPAWANVATGSGQTYRGVASNYYAEFPNVTGAFYANGRLFYTLAGQSGLYWRWFSPDSGIVGSDEAVITGADFSTVQGIVQSGSTLYYATSDGNVHSMAFAGLVPDPSTAAVVSGPSVDGVDWRARSLFLYGTPTFTSHAPVAAASSSCVRLTCTFDGTASGDPDPGDTIASYAWNFGDGSTGTGANPSHHYASAATFTVTLTVTDNHGNVGSPWTGHVTTTSDVVPVVFVGSSGVDSKSANPSVTVPSGTSTGDTELVFVTTAVAGVTTSPSGSGWTQIGHATNGVEETTIFSRPSPGSDAGASIAVPLTSAAKADVRLAVYHAVGGTTVVLGTDNKSATHTTPATALSVDGSFVVSYWALRSANTVTWTPPPAVTVRGTGVGTSTGHIDALLGDSGSGQPAGPYPGQTANSGAITAQGVLATVVLAPVQ